MPRFLPHPRRAHRIGAFALATFALASSLPGGALAQAPSPSADPVGSAQSTVAPSSIPSVVPQELVGSWFSGTISSIQFYDPIANQWAAPNGDGFYFVFGSDGRYEEGAAINNTQFNCSIQLLGRAVGTLVVDGTNLTLNQESGLTHVTNTCSGVGENVMGIATRSHGWSITTDEVGRALLSLTQPDGGIYGTFWRWES